MLQYVILYLEISLLSILKMPHLSLEERNRLLGHLQAGGSPTDVAKLFGISRQSLYKIVSKYEEDGSLKNRPRSGRPRVTNPQTDNHIVATYRATPIKQAYTPIDLL